MDGWSCIGFVRLFMLVLYSMGINHKFVATKSSDTSYARFASLFPVDSSTPSTLSMHSLVNLDKQHSFTRCTFYIK